jgi:uncharacterized protein
MNFEWDENKRIPNLRTHGLDFIDAVPLFDGHPLVTRPSSRQGESRVVSVGRLGEKLSLSSGTRAVAASG